MQYFHDFTLPMWGFEVANYKTEKYITNTTKRGDVVMQ